MAIKERFDTADPTTRMMSQFTNVINEQYIEQLRFNVKKGLRAKAEQGLWVGDIPYGYRAVDKDTITPDEAAPVIREAFRLYATGRYSMAKLADALNAQGVGKHLVVESLRDILKNPAYIGDVRCAGQRYPGTHEPLVDAETWQQAQDVREARGGGQRSGAKGESHAYGLLLGIGRCYACGMAIWQQKTDIQHWRYHYYKCAARNRRTACSLPMQQMATVDDHLLGLISGFILSAQQQRGLLTKLQRQPTPAPSGPTSASIEKQMDRLTMAWSDRSLSDSAYTTKIAQLKAQLVSTPPAPAPAIDIARAQAYLSDLGRILEVATLDEQRQVVQALLRQVWISDNQVKAIQPTNAFMTLWAGLRTITCAHGAGDGTRTRNQ